MIPKFSLKVAQLFQKPMPLHKQTKFVSQDEMKYFTRPQGIRHETYSLILQLKNPMNRLSESRHYFTNVKVTYYSELYEYRVLTDTKEVEASLISKNQKMNVPKKITFWRIQGGYHNDRVDWENLADLICKEIRGEMQKRNIYWNPYYV